MEDAAYKTDSNSPYASNVGYNRYTYRTNLDLKLTPTTKVYFGTDGTLAISNNPGISNTDYIWAAQAYLNPLILPTVYSNGLYPAAGTNALTSPSISINHRGRRTDQSFSGKATLAVEQDLKVPSSWPNSSSTGRILTFTVIIRKVVLYNLHYTKLVGRNADGTTKYRITCS